MELGGQVTLLRVDDSGTTSTGIGARFSVDITQWLSFVTDVNYFPSDDFQIEQSQITYHRRRTEVLAGARLGYRANRWGVYANVQPGFTRLTDKGVDCEGAVCPLIILALPQYHTEFTLNLGGGVEFDATRRIVARIEFGDTIIQHRSTLAPPCASGDCTSHNFSTRLGLGFRF